MGRRCPLSRILRAPDSGIDTSRHCSTFANYPPTRNGWSYARELYSTHTLGCYRGRCTSYLRIGDFGDAGC